MDHGPPGSSVHGILQTRILKWVAMPPPGNLPDPGIEPASLLSPALAGGLFTIGTTWEAPWGGSGQLKFSWAPRGSVQAARPLRTQALALPGWPCPQPCAGIKETVSTATRLLPLCSQSRPFSLPLVHPAEKTGSDAPVTAPPRSERAGRVSD